jgi:hypothetical protein
MSPDAWPSPDAPPAPLPRIEDLPIAEQGYDQEAVRLAFDSFYRHAAQLDASLRALEAVEVFRRDADALRNDLRALRAIGLGAQQEPAWARQTYERAPRAEIPGTAVRLAVESALIIAVAVIAGVADFSAAVTVALMGGAFLVVALSELLASRARFVPPAVAFLPAEGEPAPYVEVPAWSAPAIEPAEDTEPDALTAIESASDEAVAVEDEAGEPEEDDEEEDEEEGEAADPWEQTPEADEPEPELAERGGIFKRRRR